MGRCRMQATAIVGWSNCPAFVKEVLLEIVTMRLISW